MNHALARILTRLYPRRWRERYGVEFEAFLRDSPNSPGAAANVARSALLERIFPTQGEKMEQQSISFGGMLQRPSAFVPLAMSLTALALLLGHIWVYGVVRETDEGAVAHLWQILMAGQLPVLAFFAVKWLRRAPRQALGVLAVQAGAVLASVAPVLYFNL